MFFTVYMYDLKKNYFQVSKRGLLYSTIHLLHEHGLGRSEYLRLAEDPITLVETLYQDPSILERGRGISQHHPGISHSFLFLT